MQPLAQFLTRTYGFSIADFSAAPRGLVAETFFVTTTDRQRLFVKVIEAPLFKAHLRHSAAAHVYLAHQLGDRINHPVPAADGTIVTAYGSALVAVSTCIDAPAADGYDTYTFGQFIGQLHRLQPPPAVPIRQIGVFAHVALLDTLATYAFTGTGPHAHVRALAPVLAPWRATYDHYRARLAFFTHRQKNRPPQPLVVTHGDAGGNVLARSATDLYVIDWDYVGYAEPERDLWVFEHDPAFIAGYQSQIPSYRPNEERLQYAAYRQFFDYFTYILDTFTRIPPRHDSSAATANLLSLFTDWCPPHLR